VNRWENKTDCYLAPVRRLLAFATLLMGG